MENNGLKAYTEELLKQGGYATEDGYGLRIPQLLEDVNALKPELIAKLLADEKTRAAFFKQIGEATVFNERAFKEFINYSSSHNSYSAYLGQQIGLYLGDSSLMDRGEVVLNFPFKDCVLEGGQSTEEGTDASFGFDAGSKDYKETLNKRREVFYNEVLARDEIDQLFAPKAFTHARCYDSEGEHPVTDFHRDENGMITDNLLIKGNNLLALHSLQKEFAGRVKLIYIDPPYNTGKDGFKYNDSFSHSSWLSFMKNRLEIAKNLLSNDGLIVLSIDTSRSNANGIVGTPEMPYLHILLDEVFGRKNFIGNLHWKKKKQPSFLSRIAGVMESILIYAKDESCVDKLQLGQTSDSTKRIDNADNNISIREIPAGIRFMGVDNYFIKSGDYKNKTMTTTFLDDVVIKNGRTINSFRAKAKYRVSQKEIDKFCSNDLMYITERCSFRRFKTKEEELSGKTITDLLLDWGQNQDATDELRKLFNIDNDEKAFDNPKPELLIGNIILSMSEENDIILDYHLGSGTTAAVAHKLNRQYIGIEQMDYIESLCLTRLQKVISGEQGGISKSVHWQGGGTFVYLELAKKNEQAMELITATRSYDELVALFTTLSQRYFLHYNLNVKEFEERVMREDTFKALPLERQKEIFARMLDLNQMWVNRDEMNDEQFGLTSEDIVLTDNFYKQL